MQGVAHTVLRLRDGVRALLMSSLLETSAWPGEISLGVAAAAARLGADQRPAREAARRR
jgi:hypothetical protein